MSEIIDFLSSSIEFIIAIIVLIVFFFMANNISLLRQKIDSIESIVRHYAIRDELLIIEKKTKKKEEPIPWQCKNCRTINHNLETNCKRCGEDKPKNDE